MNAPQTEKPDWATRLFPGLFSYARPDSLVNRLRGQRMGKLLEMIRSVKVEGRRTRILDIGGTAGFWKHLGGLPPDTHEILLLNLQAEPIDPDQTNIRSIAGSAMELPFEDQSYDIVFSNSVIEHVGSRENQQKMAGEILRVGARHIIQTPSLWFPLEPHARLPFFQFLPRSVRAWMIFHFNINYFPKGATYRDCLFVSDSTILLTHRDMQRLFPDSAIMTERFSGIPKSYVAVSSDF